MQSASAQIGFEVQPGEPKHITCSGLANAEEPAILGATEAAGFANSMQSPKLQLRLQAADQHGMLCTGEAAVRFAAEHVAKCSFALEWDAQEVCR